MNEIYHEKQSRELCALHVLNNIFQAKDAFTQKELDNICYTLSPDTWINPHKSLLGFGNYDVNVVTAALHNRHCDIIWFDRRKDPNKIRLENVIGFILNIPNDYKLGWLQLPFKRKHWIGLRGIHGQYYNLDSKLKRPERIGRAAEFVNYLRIQLAHPEKQLLLVVDQSVAEEQSWKIEVSF